MREEEGGGEYEDGELGSGVGVLGSGTGNSLSEELGSVRKADPNESWEELDLDLGVRGECGCRSVGRVDGEGYMSVFGNVLGVSGKGLAWMEVVFVTLPSFIPILPFLIVLEALLESKRVAQ